MAESESQDLKDSEPRTPPPSYDEAVKKENLPSYNTVETYKSVVHVVVTTQPAAAEPQVNSAPPVSRQEEPRQEEPAEEKCDDLCEPYYDPNANSCLVCFFCNFICRPIATCGSLLQETCAVCWAECCTDTGYVPPRHNYWINDTSRYNWGDTNDVVDVPVITNPFEGIHHEDTGGNDVDTGIDINASDWLGEDD